MLPGPWQDSQPAFLALSPGAFNRMCVAEEIATAVAATTPETTISLRRLPFRFLESPSRAGGLCIGSFIGVQLVFGRSLRLFGIFVSEEQNRRRKDTPNTWFRFLKGSSAAKGIARCLFIQV